MAVETFPQTKKKISFAKRQRIQEALWGYLLITPNFLIILVFTFIPVFFALYMSMTDWNILSDPNFIGLENYEKIISDPLARQTFINTLYFTAVSVPINVFLTLLLGVLLTRYFSFGGCKFDVHVDFGK